MLIFIDGMMHGNWLKSTLLGIALLMSMIPEEFLVILTIFPALGAWRLSSKKVLTRRISAIDTLGSISVLCVDKTGTITQNSMQVSQLWVDNLLYHVNTSNDHLPKSARILIQYAMLSSQAQPFDPMEKAFYQLGKRYLNEAEYLHSDWKLVHEYALSSELPAMSHVWKVERIKINILNSMGMVYYQLGKLPQSTPLLEAAYNLYHRLEDWEGVATGLTNLGWIYRFARQLEQAQKLSQEALALFRQLGDSLNEARILNNLAIIAFDQGNLAQAKQYFQELQPLFESQGDAVAAARVANNLGMLHKQLGQSAEAVNYYERALTAHRQSGNRRSEALTLHNLGAVQRQP